MKSFKFRFLRCFSYVRELERELDTLKSTEKEETASELACRAKVAAFDLLLNSAALHPDRSPGLYEKVRGTLEFVAGGMLAEYAIPSKAKTEKQGRIPA